MNILMIFVWWPLIGLISIFMVTTGHLIVSYVKGYDSFEWWAKHGSEINRNLENKEILFVIGLMIWPIRLVQFVSSIPVLYEVYDLRE